MNKYKMLGKNIQKKVDEKELYGLTALREPKLSKGKCGLVRELEARYRDRQRKRYWAALLEYCLLVEVFQNDS